VIPGEQQANESRDGLLHGLQQRGQLARLGCLNAGAQTRRPSPFLAFQLWALLHGMTDLRAGKPEMPWPAADEMIDHYLVCLGLRTPQRPRA
jgi:hypothetical protein